MAAIRNPRIHSLLLSVNLDAVVSAGFPTFCFFVTGLGASCSLVFSWALLRLPFLVSLSEDVWDRSSNRLLSTEPGCPWVEYPSDSEVDGSNTPCSNLAAK